jgi:hypothetical protein
LKQGRRESPTGAENLKKPNLVFNSAGRRNLRPEFLFSRLSLHKKQISPRINTDGTDKSRFVSRYMHEALGLISVISVNQWVNAVQLF